MDFCLTLLSIGALPFKDVDHCEDVGVGPRGSRASCHPLAQLKHTHHAPKAIDEVEYARTQI